MRKTCKLLLLSAAVTLSLGAPSFAKPTPPAATRAGVASWTVDKAQSKIRFRSSFSGMAFEGGFSRWDAQIAFDPKNLAGSKVTVSVDLASAGTGDEERDSALPSADWFDTAKTPRATFVTTGFKDLGGGKYLTTGTLTLRRVTRPVSLPFTLTLNGQIARVSGVASVNRSQFGVGQGQFQAADTVPYEVAVPITLVARRNP